MKPIPGHPGYYCDRIGGIFSDKTGELRRMKTRIDRGGYETIALRNVGGGYTYPTVHRLVLQTYVGPGKGLHCNHKNGIRTDNRLENLEWLTCLENERHARRVLGKKLYGEYHPVSKMTADTVRELRELREQGWTLTRLADRFGIGISQTARIIKREKWAHI